MPARSHIAIAIGLHQLTAVHATERKGQLCIQRTLAEPRPDSIDPADAEATGSWVAHVLEQAGIPRGKATIVLGREHVVLKRLTLPTVVESELPEMTRLTMLRDLPFDADGAVMDYLPTGDDGTRTNVIAVAAPKPAIDAVRQVIDVAGWKVQRIALRSMGMVSLLRTLEAPDRCRLVVEVSRGNVDFSVVVDGEVQFSRATNLSLNLDDPNELADALRTETRRTWMSYRITEGTREVDEVLVFGDRDQLGPTAEALGELLQKPSSVLVDHPEVDEAGEHVERVWPLVGLMLETMHDALTVDLEHPRRPPNRKDERRRVALMAVGFALTMLMLAIVLSQRSLADLRETVEAKKTEYGGLYGPDCAYYRERFRYQHVQKWSELSPDWLGHLNALATEIPSADRVVLNQWSGAMRTVAVAYEKDGSSDWVWRDTPALALLVDGEAVDRATADAVRNRFVSLDWIRAESSGSDRPGGRRYEFPFTYRLETARATFDDAAPANEEAAE